MEDEILKYNISTNIVKYRKQLGLTQYDMAEKLNYSDKAVSKWERGDALPDVLILNKIAKLFNVSIDVLISDPDAEVKLPPTKKKKNNPLVITLLSVGIVWLTATVLFVMLNIFDLLSGYTWLSFIYAIPVSMIVTIVFSAIWGKKRIFTYLSISILIWSLLLSIFLTFYVWLVFILGIPLQILTILWYFRKKNN